MSNTPQSNTSQQERVLIQIREKILRGAFEGGRRLAEIPLAKQFGVSRTPVKLALMKLEEEGLVAALPTGGYAACQLSNQILTDGIFLRGALEGMAARLLAEKGMPDPVCQEFIRLLQTGDALLADYPDNTLDVRYDDYLQYEAMNDRFHELLVDACGNRALLRSWELNNRRPSASPSATLPLHDSNNEAVQFLRHTHQQHHMLVQAIHGRQGTRAFALAEEHAAAASGSLDRYFAVGPDAPGGWSATPTVQPSHTAYSRDNEKN